MMVLGLLAVLLAYQLPARHRVDIGGYDAAYTQGFYDAERQGWGAAARPYLAGSDGSARWSRGESYLLFPQIGMSAELTLRLQGWQAPDGSRPEVTVLNNQTELARFTLGPGWQEQAIALRGELLKPNDVLIVMRASTTRLADGREVGVLLDRAELRTSGWPILPYPAQLLYGALAGGLLFVLAHLAGNFLPPRHDTEDFIGGLSRPTPTSDRPKRSLVSRVLCLVSAPGWAVVAGIGLTLAFLLLYRLQPPLYPYPLRSLLPLADGLLVALVALRLAPWLQAHGLARSAVCDAAAALIVAVWAGALLLAARAHVTLSVPGVEKDFRVYATRTGSLAEVFKADGFYNLGYPLLLWLAQPLTEGNAFLAGRLLSALAGALLLGAGYLLARTLLGATPALVALIALALSPLVVQYGLYVGSDMPFAALVTLALALLFSVSLSRVSLSPGLLVCLSGAAAGGAFLARHPGLLLLPFGLLTLWAASRWGGLRDLRRFAALFVLGFALLALPQLAVNTWQTGSLLYSQQAKNIWLGVYGNTDWRRWGEAPDSISLAYVVLHDPGRFLANWAGNLRAYVGSGAEDTSEFGRAVQLRLLGWPANWLALAGLLAMLWQGTWRERLLLAWVALYVAAVSVAFVLPRFVLPLTPIYALAAAWTLREVLGRASSPRRPQLALLAGLLLVALLWPGWRMGVGYVLDNQPAAEVAVVDLVERTLAPAEQLLVGAPDTADAQVFAESPLAKYSAIAHRVTRRPADAAFLLSTQELGALGARSLSLVATVGQYHLYRVLP